MSKKALIIGAGGHSRAIISILNQIKEYDTIEIIDLNYPTKNIEERILGISVKSIDALNNNKNSNVSIFLAIGENNLREFWFKKLINDFFFPNLISPLALIDDSAKFGSGNIICPFAIIGPEVQIGNNNIINTASIIEHEVTIGNNCHVAPSATICGRSSLGNNCLLGANATIIDKINICNFTNIGAGSTVIRSIYEESLTLAGSPAKKILKI